MSLVISIINVGMVPNILDVWVRAWIMAFLVAFPTTYFVSPVVQRLVTLTIKPDV